MATQKAFIEKEISLEDSKSPFVYSVKLPDGVLAEASSKKKYNIGDSVKVSETSHVPAIFQIFEGDE